MSEENNYVKMEDIEKIIPARIKESHKGTYGHVALLGGAIEYSGAIRLSAMALAALKSGAGLSTIAIPKFLVPIISKSILEVMIYPLESTEEEILFSKENIDGLLKKVDVLACGMGLGKSQGAHEIIYYIIRNFTGKLILDADALNIVAENIDVLKESKSRIILTPHMMEFKRLYNAVFENDLSFDEFEKNKIENTKRFVQNYKVILLLKGPTTIIVTRDLNNEINDMPVEEIAATTKVSYVNRGTPGMATAGSGDVLSGILAGFLGYIKNEYDATVVAAYINGLAGELAAKEMGEISMLSSDTVRHIPDAIKKIKENSI